VEQNKKYGINKIVSLKLNNFYYSNLRKFFKRFFFTFQHIRFYRKKSVPKKISVARNNLPYVES
jgi:hypothetical protein